MMKMDNVKLSEVLAYVLQSERNHWLEAGEPAEHVYMKAFDCMLELVKQKHERIWNNG